MLRRFAIVIVGSALLLPIVAVPAAAATVERLVVWYGGGDLVQQETDGSQTTVTEVGFSLASASATTAELVVRQDVYTTVPDDGYGDLVTERYADIAAVPVSVDLTRLSSASISAGGDGATWQECDAASWTCSDVPFSVSATWTGVGPVLHNHQMENELQVGITRFGANSVGASRLETASVVLNGAPLTGSAPEGILPMLFRQTQGSTTIQFGPLSPAATLSAPTLHANLSDLQAIANTSIETSDSFGSTGLIASTVAYLDDGTELDDAVFYSSFTQFIDPDGNAGSWVDVEGIGPGRVSIDRTLGSASASATLPVSVCVYPPDFSLPPSCTPATVDVVGSWIATDKLAHTLLTGNSVIAGTWVYGLHTSTQSRTADAVVTVGGVDAGPSTESSIVSTRTSINSVNLQTTP